MKTIAEEMTEFLSVPNNTIVEYGNYKAADFNLLLRVLNETLDNFVIFENRGGRKFHIWTMNARDLKECMDGSMRAHTYYYKLKGVEYIVKKLL